MNPPVDPSSIAEGDPAQVITSAWSDQALWSAVATKIGDSIRWWRVVAAAAGLGGLFLSILAGTMTGADQSGPRMALTTVGVLLLALVPYLRQRLVSPERVQAWTTARNVSEQLKEAIYRHLMGVLPPEPLADGSAPPDAAGPGNLVRRCRTIKLAAVDLAGVAAAARAADRPRKTQLTLDDYLADRVEGQISYYRRKGEAAGRAAKRLQAIEFGLGVTAVILGTLTGSAVPGDGGGDPAKQIFTISALLPLLAVVAAATAAVTGHIAGAREAEIAAKYFATYDLLKTIRDEWRVSPEPQDPANVRRLADTVERATASEYGGWVSDWNKAQQKAPQA
jgi:SMODS and SLOG-associating 2TM effector domain 1